MVKIKFFGIMKAYMPETEEDGFWHADRDGVTVGQLMDETGASEKDVAVTILVNKVRKTKEYVLQDGDTLTVMPLVAGG